jgi:hypothetical protein
MPTITLSISLGEILATTVACILGIILCLRCRTVRRAADLPVRNGHGNAFLERGDLVSKLAVVVSIMVTRAKAHPTPGDDHDTQLLDALRESGLAIVESTWLRDLENAYEDSKNRRIGAYEQSKSVAELRAKIANEDCRLRQEIEAVSHRLEEVLDTSHGRYARASDKLASALQRILE